eukprot:3575851-Prymnesium_polylepis.1
MCIRDRPTTAAVAAAAARLLPGPQVPVPRLPPHDRRKPRGPPPAHRGQRRAPRQAGILDAAAAPLLGHAAAHDEGRHVRAAPPRESGRPSAVPHGCFERPALASPLRPPTPLLPCPDAPAP